MRFDIITLFPELFGPFLASGVTRRAYASGQVDVRLFNPRDYAEGNYRRVDDRPFGGGPGMVMMAPPLERCLAAIRAERAESPASQAPLVLFSPIGKVLNHTTVAHWSASQGAILLCGRYEGIDQRFIDAYVDVQMSLGDFVLSGGEIAALALLDGRKIGMAVCDVNMPRMNGIEFVKAAKALPAYRFLPVLMLTTESQESKKEEGKAAGAKAWMVKPFSGTQLLNAVSKLSA